MNFTLNGRILKYVNEECIMIKMENNWKGFKKGDWKELSICNHNSGYKFISFSSESKKYLLHRLIGYLFLGLNIDDRTQEIDHINHIKNDNRVENLRIVTSYENKLNTTRIIKGYNKFRDKFEAKINVNGNRIRLGLFETEEEARQAYLDAKQKYHLIE